MKYGLPFILFGLFIDGLQAFVSLGLMAMSGVILTVAPIAGIGLGATVGLVVGGIVVGGVCILTAGTGCVAVAVGGALAGAGAGAGAGGVIGTTVGTMSIPTSIVLGFAINMCLSFTLGSMLIGLLWFSGMLYPKYLFGGLGEIIPGINNIPFWTGLAIASVLRKKAEEKDGVLSVAAGAITGALSPGGVVGKSVGGVMLAKEHTVAMANSAEAFNSSVMNLPGMRQMKEYKEQQDEQGDWLERADDEPAHKTRQILNDIRPIKKAAVLLLALALGAGIGVHAVYAQTDPVQFLITPEVPGPNQSVRVEVQGIGTFLGDATITWQENGKTVLQGVGEKVFTFTTGNIGTATKIHVIIDSSVQGTITRDFTYIPATVNLVWEANTTVPPFYAGKALYSAGSQVTVLALPQVVSGGKTITSNNLSFRWSINGSPDEMDSGTGRPTLTFSGSQLRTSEQISLDVYFGDVRVAQGALYIPATDPELLLYVQDPLRGTLWDQALPSSMSLNGTEVSLKAQPYYFSKESLDNGLLSYTWTLDRNPTAGPDSANGLLTLRQTGSGAGSSNLAVSLQNNDSSKFVQTANTVLRILFGGQASVGSSSFGV